MKRLTLVVAAGLLLSGCASVHPGAAAVVDGRTISMKTLDRTATIYCLDAARQAQDADLSDQRSRAAVDLVLSRVADDLVEERGLVVDDSLAELPPEAVPSIEEAFGSRSDQALAVIRESVGLGAKLVAIGADATGEAPTDANLQELQNAGYQTVGAALADHDVTFDPRLGVGRDGEVTGDLGSLSVLPPSVDEAPDGALAPTLQCSD